MRRCGLVELVGLWDEGVPKRPGAHGEHAHARDENLNAPVGLWLSLESPLSWPICQH